MKYLRFVLLLSCTPLLVRPCVAQSSDPVVAQVTYRLNDEQMQVAFDDGREVTIDVPVEHRPKKSVFQRPIVGPIAHFSVFLLAKIVSSGLALKLASMNPYLYPVVATVGDVLVFYATVVDGTTLLLDSIESIEAKSKTVYPQTHSVSQPAYKTLHGAL